MEQTLALSGIRGFDPLDLATGNATAPAGPTGTTAGGASFAELLQSAAGQAVDSLRGAEQVSVKAITGDADMREVTDAILNAQQNLQAAIAIRDKIVTAFLEVSRMQI